MGLKGFNDECEEFLDECFFNYSICLDKFKKIYNTYIDIEKYNIIIGFDSSINCNYNSFKISFSALVEIQSFQEKILVAIKNKQVEKINISDLKNRISNLKFTYLNYKKAIESDKILDAFDKVDKVIKSKKCIIALK